MTYWYFPSNPNVFDMVRCLHERDEIDQPFYSSLAKRSASVGDIVYIYVSVGYAQILYKMEVIAVFKSFDEVNQGRWAKYIGHNQAPAKGRWVRMRILDYANPAYKPLQCGMLRMNGILTSPGIYPLSKAKADYINAEMTASKA